MQNSKITVIMQVEEELAKHISNLKVTLQGTPEMEAEPGMVIALVSTIVADGLLPILVGIAAAGALDRYAFPGPSIKWPNDLQLGGRKLGGILCEATWDAAGPAFVVVGIGINVAHFPDDFPPELRETATSLRAASDGMWLTRLSRSCELSRAGLSRSRS